jgi:hypothetical protein
MAVNLSFIGGAGWQFFDDNGDPLSGGKIYTYAAGTTTPLTTYTSRDGLTPNTNPVILDAAGRTPQEIWATEGLLYKYVVKTSADVLIRSWDNVGGSVVASNLAQELANTTDNTKGDALVGFRQNNSSGFLLGSVGRTVNAKLTESVSVKDFGAVGDGATDDTAAIQAAIDFCKSKPGYNLRFPRGEYLVTTSLDCTYAGSAAGISSGYYGFSVEGEDQINTFISGATSGTPVWDCTGKPRMTFRNIGFSNYTDGAHNPSCALLLTRNLTNGFGGGHSFTNVEIRGYYTQVAVMSASSEGNTWIRCQFEPFSQVPSFAITEQLLPGVTSSYINLSGHVLVGGNTTTSFISSYFLTLYGSTVNALLLGGIDNASFVGCYSKSNGNAAFRFISNCGNVKIINIRDESEGLYFAQLDASVTLSGFSVSGRASRGIRAEDLSSIIKSDIRPDFMVGASGFSLDAYDCTETDVQGMTNAVRVRNDAYKSRFYDYKLASEWTFPTGARKTPEFYWLSYIGGQINYSRQIMNADPFRRDEFSRTEINNLVLPETLVSAATGNYTPDYSVAGCFAFDLVGNLSVLNPTNVNLNVDDGYGQVLILNFKQDATGGRSVSFASGFDLGGATVSTAVNALTSFMFVFSALGKWVRVR